MSDSTLDRWTVDLRQKPMLLGAALVLITLVLYSPVTRHEFLRFDDASYVTDNFHVNTGLNFRNIVWAFTTSDVGHWHPLTWLSHMTDCQLFGVNSAAHHLVNLAFHMANVFLLYFLLYKATAAVWRSFFVAALFAVHPLNVENVAWVAERKSLLCTFFFFLAILAYGWYVRQPGWKRYLIVLAAFALALLSKAMAVTLPLVLLLLDYWPLERYEGVSFLRKWSSLIVEKLPMVLMSVASSIAAILAARNSGAMTEEATLPLSLRLANAIVSYVIYLGKLFWPAKLSVFYPHPKYDWSSAEVLGSAVFLVSITVLVLYFRRRRYLAVGWVLFVITLIPVIGVVQAGALQGMADRYAYIPYIGPLIILAWGLNDLAEAVKVPRMVPGMASFCMIVALAAGTAHYLPYWQNGVSLFTRANNVASRPDPALEQYVGDALHAAGRYNEALRHYSKACELSPGYAYCHYNMAEILYYQNQLQEALEQYQIAGRLTADRNIALSCLINSGEILIKLGDYKTAQMEIAGALQIDPNNGAALALSEQVLEKTGQRR